MRLFSSLRDKISSSFEERSRRIEKNQIPDFFVFQILFGFIVSILFGTIADFLEPMTLRHAVAKFGSWFPSYLNMLILLCIMGKGVEYYILNILGWLCVQASLIPLIVLCINFIDADSIGYVAYILAFLVVFIDVFLLLLACLTISEKPITEKFKTKVRRFSTLTTILSFMCGAFLFDTNYGRNIPFVILVFGAFIFAVETVIYTYDKAHKNQYYKKIK